MAQNYAKMHGIVTWPNATGSDVSSGDIVEIGDGRIGIATVDIANGSSGIVLTDGVYSLLKASSAEVDAFADDIFYDSAGGGVTNVKATDLPKVGQCVAASATGKSYVEVEINVPATSGKAAKIDSGAGSSATNWAAIGNIITALENAGIVLPY